MLSEIANRPVYRAGDWCVDFVEDGEARTAVFDSPEAASAWIRACRLSVREMLEGSLEDGR